MFNARPFYGMQSRRPMLSRARVARLGTGPESRMCRDRETRCKLPQLQRYLVGSRREAHSLLTIALAAAACVGVSLTTEERARFHVSGRRIGHHSDE